VKFADKPRQHNKHTHRQPDPYDFADQGVQSPLAEDIFQSDGRDLDRGPAEEVSGLIERRQQGDAQPAVGEGVEYAVTGVNQEKETEQGPPLPGEYFAVSEKCAHDKQAQQQGAKGRVKKAPVPEEMAVVDVQRKTDNVQVGKRGANSSQNPEAPGHVFTHKSPPGYDADQ